MTTRREFIQGVLAGMVALVLPKTAKAMPIDEPVVEPEHGLLIDGKGSWSDFVNPAAKLYGPGYIDRIHFPECSIGKLTDE